MLGVVATLVSGALALDERRTVHQPQVSPSWGQYTDPQWRTLERRYGSIRMATSSPPLAIVSARSCLVVLRGMTHLATVCRPSRALQLFTWRGSGMKRVVGITSPAVSYVTATGRGYTQGMFLMPAPHGHVFGAGLRNATTFVAYCASALRAVCGDSAQRRS